MRSRTNKQKVTRYETRGTCSTRPYGAGPGAALPKNVTSLGKKIAGSNCDADCIAVYCFANCPDW